MTRVVLGAVVLLAAAGVAFVVLRAPSDAGFGTGPAAATAASSAADSPGVLPATPPGPGGNTAGNAAGTQGTVVPSGPNAPATGHTGGAFELQERPIKAKGTPAALSAELQAARAAEDATARDQAISRAWAEYLALARREGAEAVRRAALDELLAMYHGEPDSGVRVKLLDRIDASGTEAIVQVMLEAARTGRTESERVSAIQNLGKFGEAGAVTARMYLHPDAPDQVTAARETAKLRTRARGELQAMLPGAQSDAERAAIEFALQRLNAGEKR